MKTKSPGLAKATGIIEIIMGTALILLSISFLTDGDSAQGSLLLVPGILFWLSGIFFFRFSRGAWFANFILLILAKTGIFYIMLELVKEFGGWVMEDEFYVLFGLMAICLMLLVFTIIARKHLK
ncbi:MAG: hypothetical protein JXR53_06205 [Bacteroidales bacterium]|nr:hypothetical protein [Bacteroidales bacterium]